MYHIKRGVSIHLFHLPLNHQDHYGPKLKWHHCTMLPCICARKFYPQPVKSLYLVPKSCYVIIHCHFFLTCIYFNAFFLPKSCYVIIHCHFFLHPFISMHFFYLKAFAHNYDIDMSSSSFLSFFSCMYVCIVYVSGLRFLSSTPLAKI